MIKVFVVYLHLLATCLAVGLVLAADLKLLGALRPHLGRSVGSSARPLRIAPPNGFVRGLVAAALVMLVTTGGVLVALALAERPDALANPKLQAKLLLVGLLVVNAVVLHTVTFPALARRSVWVVRSMRDLRPLAMSVALPVSISTALWGYCAFLGIARPWNFTVPLVEVLAWGLGVVAALWATVTAVLAAATWRRPTRLERLAPPTPAARPATPRTA
ncbi:MAG: hypothetical protein MUC74_07150 [Ideonella sp.]|nr:hypothetical protein [Ideonella sp.]